MKNLFKMMTMALVASALLLTSCGKEEEPNNNGNNGNNGDTPTTVAAPTNLAATNIFQTAATLTWESTESQFEVTVNGNTEVVDAKMYKVKGLTAGNQFTWSVKAKKGTETSAAATNSFTTAALPTTTGVHVNFDGTTWTTNTLYGVEGEGLWLGLAYQGDLGSIPHFQIAPETALGTTTPNPQIDVAYYYYSVTDAAYDLTDAEDNVIATVGDHVLVGGKFNTTAYSVDGISMVLNLEMAATTEVFTPEGYTESFNLDITIVDMPMTAFPAAKSATIKNKMEKSNLRAVAVK